MMSPKLLERATFSYRKGYLAGYFGEPKEYDAPSDSLKPFSQFDFDEGYTAGRTDKFNNDRVSELLKQRRAKRCENQNLKALS